MFRVTIFFSNGKYVSDEFAKQEDAQAWALEYIEAFSTAGMGPMGYKVAKKGTRKKRTTKK